MSNPVLEVKCLSKTFIVNKYSTNVLQNIDFTLNSDEFITIMGPSGSGKSTLLYCVSGMDEMTSGAVILDGSDITKMSKNQMTEFRLKKMGFVFQQMYMLKKLSIMDNILLPGFQAKKKSRKQVISDVQNLMRRFNIIDVADHEITEYRAESCSVHVYAVLLLIIQKLFLQMNLQVH